MKRRVSCFSFDCPEEEKKVYDESRLKWIEEHLLFFSALLALFFLRLDLFPFDVHILSVR